MNATALVLQVIDALEGAMIPYMLVGSYSSNYFGRTRSTNDADFVIQYSGNQLADFVSKLGPTFRLETQMSFESITMTSRYVLHHRGTAFKIELFLLSDDVFDRERFANRRQVDFDNRLAWLPIAEDVVIMKVRWAKLGGRSKDVDDVRNILSLRGARLDLAYIRKWTDLHGSREAFEQIWNEAITGPR